MSFMNPFSSLTDIVIVHIFHINEIIPPPICIIFEMLLTMVLFVRGRVIYAL
jgi:hypothetical protein